MLACFIASLVEEPFSVAVELRRLHRGQLHVVEAVDLGGPRFRPGGGHLVVGVDAQRHRRVAGGLEGRGGVPAHLDGDGLVVLGLDDGHGDAREGVQPLDGVGGVVQGGAERQHRGDPVRVLLRHLDGGHPPEGVAHGVDPLRIDLPGLRLGVDPAQHPFADAISHEFGGIQGVRNHRRDHGAGVDGLESGLGPGDGGAVGQQVVGIAVAVEHHDHGHGSVRLGEVHPGAQLGGGVFVQVEVVDHGGDGAVDVLQIEVQPVVPRAAHLHFLHIEVLVRELLRHQPPAVAVGLYGGRLAAEGVQRGSAPARGLAGDGEVRRGHALRQRLSRDFKGRRQLAPLRHLGPGHDLPFRRRSPPGQTPAPDTAPAASG